MWSPGRGIRQCPNAWPNSRSPPSCSQTPIIFGPAVHNHPVDAPDLFTRHNILGVVVACEWQRQMFAVHWGDKVHAWPVGIDTDRWVPTPDKDIDVLVYEKIRCHPERDRAQVRDPILASLGKTGLKVARIAYSVTVRIFLSNCSIR